MNRSKLTFFLLGKKYGFNLAKTLAFVKDSQYWSKEQITAYQNKHLQQLITHAYNNVPYYTKQFNALNLKPSDIKTKEDLHKLPIINKKIVADNFNDFLAKDFKERKTLRRHTGGTTGLAFEFYNDVKSWAINWAVKKRAFEWGKYVVGKDKLAVLAGGSLLPQDGMGLKDRLWRYLQNFHSMPITKMTPEIMHKYVLELKENKIQFLRGYPTAVYTLAKYMVNNNLKVPLTSIFTTAEMLYDYQRETMREAFGCEVYDWYGCGDGVGNALQCSKHEGFHISFETSIFEIIKNDGNEANDEEKGEVVLTSLHDYAMPFIRYAPGDIAIKGNDNCECGRKLTRINKIVGRSSDIIEFSNGITLNGLSIPFEAWTDKISKFQIVQVEKDSVEVLFIPTKGFTEQDTQAALDIMKYQCGEGVNIKISLVKKIPTPKSGKFRYVISKVS